MKPIAFVVLLSLVFFLAGCDRDKNSKKYDIYASGYNKQFSEGAAYWKNGEEFPLDDGGNQVYVIGMVVDGSDVYIFGEQYIGNTAVATATYWKNGNRVQLSDGTKSEGIRGMTVSGSDVYASGYERSPTTGDWKAKYWKNGNATLLAGITGFSSAEGIAIAGDDVHVIGFESTDTVSAKYWKNGVLISILPKLKYSFFTSITVQGSDVYIAGYNSSATHPVLTVVMKTAYWKNGSEVVLGFGETTNIVVSGSDVYVGGTGGDTNESGYWVNQTFHSIADRATGTRLGLSSVAVAGGDVIVAALGLGSGNARLGSYLWRNGELQAPFMGDDVNIEVRAIATGN